MVSAQGKIKLLSLWRNVAL